MAGRYLLGERLGRGGMGTVWRAGDRLLERPVAVKELHVSGGEGREAKMRRVLREARAIARVTHPHVIEVHDLVEFEDRLWIVMELVDGPSLAHRVEESGPLPPRLAAELGAQLLDALNAVHATGVLHRDVKPANVLLRADGRAVLTDFGIVALDDGEALTAEGALLGSLDYMAPERLTGAAVEAPSDLWSLAVTLCVAVSGEAPFARPSPTAVLHAIAYEEPVISDRAGPLGPLLTAMLRKPAEDRPSAAEAGAALRRIADGAPSPGPLYTPTTPLPAPTASLPAPGTGAAGGPGSGGPAAGGRRRARPALVAAGAVLAVAAAAGGLLITGAPPFDDSEATASPEKKDKEEKGGKESPSGGGRNGPAAPSPSATPQVLWTGRLTVDALKEWQPVDVNLEPGDVVAGRYVEGQWTVDHGTGIATGPEGYGEQDDAALAAGAGACKIDQGAPFAALLGSFSSQTGTSGQAFRDREWTYTADQNGRLYFRVNDGGTPCNDDNTGALTYDITVTRPAAQEGSAS